MKRIIFITIILLSAAFRLSAEKTADVSLRYSRQATMIRIVLEADDDFIKNSRVTASLAAIKIDFPSAFEIRKPKDFFYATVKKDRSFYIFLKDVVDVKTSWLPAPSRLIFDLQLSAKAQKEASPKPEQKTFQSSGPLVSPGPQKEAPPKPEQKPFQPSGSLMSPGPQKVPTPKPEQKLFQSSGPLVSPGPPPLQTAQKQPPLPPAAAPQPPLAAQKQQPLPPPPKPAEKPHKKRVIVLDPGHGGYDYGIVSQDAREKDVNLALSKDLSAALTKKGFTVFLDRKVDQSASLSERINFANAKSPDLFISIHAASGNGFAVYVSALEDVNVDSAIKLYGLSSRQGMHLAVSKEAAQALALHIRKDFNAEVAIRELPLPVLNSLNAPAVMIEYPSLKSYASDQKMRDKFVASVLKGISAHEQ